MKANRMTAEKLPSLGFAANWQNNNTDFIKIAKKNGRINSKKNNKSNIYSLRALIEDFWDFFIIFSKSFK